MFWIPSLIPEREIGAGKPMPHSPPMESQFPYPKIEDRYPRSGHTPPASRSSRTIPAKAETPPGA